MSRYVDLLALTVDRYRDRYRNAKEAIHDARRAERHAEQQGDEVALGNARRAVREAEEEKAELDLFKKDLGSFVRFYEFISQIVPFDDAELEKLAVYARHLRPLLRQTEDEEALDLAGVELSHYRLRKQAEHHINLKDGQGEYRLTPADQAGTGAGREPEKAPLEEIIERLNELFAGDGLSDNDRLNYFNAVKDKVLENPAVAAQIEANDSADQILLGDFPDAVRDAVLESLDAHSEIAATVLRDDQVKNRFIRLLLGEILQNRRRAPSASQAL